MADQQISVRTADGDCPAHVAIPKGEGPWPAIIIYMDALGIRPALMDMAQRLAESGYLALLPDLYYRSGDYHIPPPREVFASGNLMAVIGPLMAATGPDKAAEDTGYILGYLDTRSDVKGRRIGAVGLCMGGGMAIAAAGTWPERFAAVASFHAGRLATDDDASPHLHAPRLQAELYIAAAENDASYPPEMAERFEAALDTAGVRYRTETYPAAHGWMKPDFPVYDHDQAERGWAEMRDLFARTLDEAPAS